MLERGQETSAGRVEGVKRKAKVYRRVVRPAKLFGLERVALTKRRGVEVELEEFKMLRFSSGVTRKDRTRFGATRQEANRRFMDVMREDMQIVGVREGDAEDTRRGGGGGFAVVAPVGLVKRRVMSWTKNVLEYKVAHHGTSRLNKCTYFLSTAGNCMDAD